MTLNPKKKTESVESSRFCPLLSSLFCLSLSRPKAAETMAGTALVGDLIGAISFLPVAEWALGEVEDLVVEAPAEVSVAVDLADSAAEVLAAAVQAEVGNF